MGINLHTFRHALHFVLVTAPHFIFCLVRNCELDLIVISNLIVFILEFNFDKTLMVIVPMAALHVCLNSFLPLRFAYLFWSIL
jgi:hypothetical protein